MTETEQNVEPPAEKKVRKIRAKKPHPIDLSFRTCPVCQMVFGPYSKSIFGSRWLVRHHMRAAHTVEQRLAAQWEAK